MLLLITSGLLEPGRCHLPRLASVCSRQHARIIVPQLQNQLAMILITPTQAAPRENITLEVEACDWVKCNDTGSAAAVSSVLPPFFII